MKIQTRYYCSLNSNIRLNSDLTPYAKLVCAELLALADGDQVWETDLEIATLIELPVSIIADSLDLLEAYYYISRTYTVDVRTIKLEAIAL